jgi:hypothetical protein
VKPTKAASLALIFAVGAIIGISGRLANGEVPEEEGLQAVNTWLGKVLENTQVKIKPQKIVPIKDDNIEKIFPGSGFYGIYFATWPVAPRLPRELSYEMLVRLQRGAVEPIRDEEAVVAFLARELGHVGDDAGAATAVSASLRLAEAVAKAGSYTFEKPDVSVARQDGSIVATASAAARAPARGEITVRLDFGADGKINPATSKIGDQTRRGPPS